MEEDRKETKLIQLGATSSKGSEQQTLKVSPAAQTVVDWAAANAEAEGVEVEPWHLLMGLLLYGRDVRRMDAARFLWDQLSRIVPTGMGDPLSWFGRDRLARAGHQPRNADAVRFDA